MLYKKMQEAKKSVSSGSERAIERGGLAAASAASARSPLLLLRARREKKIGRKRERGRLERVLFFGADVH